MRFGLAGTSDISNVRFAQLIEGDAFSYPGELRPDNRRSTWVEVKASPFFVRLITSQLIISNLRKTLDEERRQNEICEYV